MNVLSIVLVVVLVLVYGVLIKCLFIHVLWLCCSCREVLTIQRFLEAAAQQEQCGKVRIQHFIENLLQRIALAERLLEYYQSSTSTSHSNHYMVTARLISD